MCGRGKEGTEQLGDCPGVTQSDDDIPKCSTHRGCLVRGDERVWGLSWRGSTLHLCFCPSPAWVAIYAKLLDGAGAVGPEGKGWGGTRIPGRQGRAQLSPRSQGMSGLGRIQSTAPLDFLKTWRMSGQATARDWPMGTADQQLTPSHSVRQPGEGRDS